jgi:hypothetical protein
MESLSGLLGALAWLGSVLVLFRLFQRKGLFHGFLGLIFPIYPFFWGIKHWGNPEYKVKNGMILWLIIGAVAAILNFILNSAA